jgi:hypothetical protein
MGFQYDCNVGRWVAQWATVPVPTFMKADLEAGRDPGLERAKSLLLGR